MKLQLCVDRLEGDKAVLLAYEKQITWPRTLLPPQVVEGDILSVVLEIDTAATEQAKAEAEALLSELTKKS